ncbi:MAG: thioredoxin family protein [Ignavibacteriaceae bacterium]|nr:thioredoxin family protein [Ignavibacteriaceae bacterium]
MEQKFYPDKRVLDGMTYVQYLEMTRGESANLNIDNLSTEEKERAEIKKLNIQRMTRIDKSYEPGIDIRDEVDKITEDQFWMVITENWCGDSAQNLPYIAKIASLNENIDLRIILRDSNPDIMDHYLTNDTRSIPKLVVFDEDGNELFRWGARPESAQRLVTDLKAQGFDKKYFLEKLHSWYARNRGTDLEKEIITLLKNTSLIKKSI